MDYDLIYLDSSIRAFSSSLPKKFVAWTLIFAGIISLGFILFCIFTSNPFIRQIPPPTNGADLNPLLQDFGLIIHPPMLYMGYVGFAISFCCALASLMLKEYTNQWAVWSKKLDTISLVIFNDGNSVRQLVGLLRTRMGWLVVLGPRRKCFINALVSRNRTNSLLKCYRKTRSIFRLVTLTSYISFWPKSARNILSSFRSLNICTCVCNRSC